jgi:phosphohistidine phosphatase
VLGTGEGPFGVDGAVPPELIVCSAAVRTRQTADLLIEASGAPLPLEPERSLYDADVDTALECLQRIDDETTSALVVGHNPTMYRLALELLRPSEEDAANGGTSGEGRDALAGHEFPTCALAALTLPAARWGDVQWGTADLLGLFTPPY